MKKGFVLAIATFSIILIARINLDPILVLEKEINFGGLRDNIFATIPTSDGFVVAGEKIVRDNTTWKSFSKVCKFDINYDIVWEYTGVENTIAWWQSLALAPDGIFLGEGWNTASILKIDNSGDLVWKKNIDVETFPIITSNENNLVVALSKTDSKIIVYDLEGNEINFWNIQLDDIFTTILDGNDLYILGDKSGGVLTNVHSEIIKADLQGNIVWTDTLMDVHGLRGAIDINGDLYVSGYYFPNAQSWYRTVKYDLDGNRIWERLYDGDLVAPYNQSNRVNSVIAHPEGGCAVVGCLVKIGSGDPNMLDGGAISYDPNGNEYFKIRYDANPLWYRTIHQASFFCPGDNCLMIFGSTWNLNPDTAQVLFATKWDNVVTGVADNDYSTPASYNLSQNYPNPFNPALP
jgi:hypothetical protein